MSTERKLGKQYGIYLKRKVKSSGDYPQTLHLDKGGKYKCKPLYLFPDIFVKEN